MRKVCLSLILALTIVVAICSVPGYANPFARQGVPNAEGSVETIKIVNDTGYSIYHIYISPSTSPEWGEDLLGPSEVLIYGDVFDTGIPVSAALYDVCCIDHEGDPYYKWGVGIKRQGEMVFSLMDLDLDDLTAPNPQLRDAALGTAGEAKLSDTIEILNNTGYTIYHLYMTPATSTDWGDDLLGVFEIIQDGQKYDTGIASDSTLYDIRLVDSDGDSYTQWDVDVSQSNTVQFTIWDLDLSSDGLTDTSTELTLTIFNATGYRIREVYISPSDSMSWGANRLESGTIIPDRGSFDTTLTGSQTVYDVKLVDSDGDSYFKWDVDVSEDEWIVFTLDDLSL